MTSTPLYGVNILLVDIEFNLVVTHVKLIARGDAQGNVTCEVDRVVPRLNIKYRSVIEASTIIDDKLLICHSAGK